MRLCPYPYPYKAAFSITDDTDKASLCTVRAVYDYMLERGVRISKTVWAFPPVEPCGIPGLGFSWDKDVTLEDPAYLQYCRELSAAGVEVCLHGASAGNNPRELTARALHRMQEEGFSTGTYICHGKNADNPYWTDQVTNWPPLQRLIRRAVKFESYGSVPGSRYFWGDLCQAHVSYIRLYRTFATNTLKSNPSMPYHIMDRPFVNFWFSATKRRLDDCTEDEALDALIRERGTTLLYHYVHRYADSGHPHRRFCESIDRIAARKEIWTEPVSVILGRLKAMQNLRWIQCENDLWLANTSRQDISAVQIEFRSPNALAPDSPVQMEHTVEQIAGLALLPVRLSRPEAPENGLQAQRVDGGICLKLPYATLTLQPEQHRLSVAYSHPTAERLELLSPPPRTELLRLMFEQTTFLAREKLYSMRPWYRTWVASRPDYAYHDHW
jgi:hypothetical protein